MQQKKDK